MTGEAAERWSRSAGAWARHAAQIDAESETVTDWMVTAAAPKPGETVLELGAGPGGVALRAAGALAGRGRVIVTDVASGMLEVARQRARALGLEDLEFAVADAMDLALPDACVDVVLCRFAFMAMSDPGGALRETHRVLRSGGRLALAVWGPAQRNPWASLAAEAVRRRAGQPAPAPGQPGMFALADEKRLASLLRGAGFESLRLERLTGERRYDSFDAWWQLRRELPPGAEETLSSMPAGKRAALEQELREQAQRYTRDDGIALPWEALMACAHRANP